jgi:hypothetical protein
MDDGSSNINGLGLPSTGSGDCMMYQEDLKPPVGTRRGQSSSGGLKREVKDLEYGGEGDEPVPPLTIARLKALQNHSSPSKRLDALAGRCCLCTNGRKEWVWERTFALFCILSSTLWLFSVSSVPHSLPSTECAAEAERLLVDSQETKDRHRDHNHNSSHDRSDEGEESFQSGGAEEEERSGRSSGKQRGNKSSKGRAAGGGTPIKTPNKRPRGDEGGEQQQHLACHLEQSFASVAGLGEGKSGGGGVLDPNQSDDALWMPSSVRGLQVSPLPAWLG